MSRHEHKWNPKTLVCVSCGIAYKEYLRETYDRAKSQASKSVPEITQLERGAKA